VVRDGEGRLAELGRAGDHRLDLRRTVQQGVLGVAVKVAKITRMHPGSATVERVKGQEEIALKIRAVGGWSG